MMKKAVYFMLMSLLTLQVVSGQNNCDPLPDCEQAPLFCGYELEHHVFNNNVSIGGGVDANCGIMPHNSVWFRILPCQSSLNLVIQAVNTQNGNGLQVALFSDCMGGTEVGCNPGTDMGWQLPLNLMANVTPGQEYWLMVDGYEADVCDFTFDILSGIDTMQPLPSSGGPFDGIITGPTGNPCAGIGVGQYTVTWPDCATWTGGGFSCGKDSCVCINWTLPLGAFIIGDACATTVLIDFSATPPGIYTLRATPECLCDDGLCETCGPICCPVNPAELVITISAPSVVWLPEILVCFEGEFPDCVFEPGGIVTGQTASCLVAVDPVNCTITRQPYRKKQPIFTNLGILALCDTVWVCQVPYTQPGSYAAFCTTPAGCDSNIIFLLVQDPDCVFECTALNEPAAPGDSCHAAPFLCGNFLDQYCGSNTGLTDDLIDGQLLQNAGFIGLQPCSETIQLRIQVGDCTPNSTGLSFALAAGECPTVTGAFTEVLEHDPTIVTFTNLDPEIPYTLIVNGMNDSECSFHIEVVEGIGTADPLPVDCSCTDGSVVGPASLCPGDLATYTINLPDCTFTGGGAVGGNGYFCLPDSLCPASDSFKLVWHIPAGTHFVGDSTGTTIQIMLDDSYADLDTIRIDSVWVSWELVAPAAPMDSLLFCSCTGIACAGKINPLVLTIQHNLQFEFCVLTCINPECNINGVPYTSPGNYAIDIDNCTRLLLTVLGDFIPPMPPFVPPVTVCEGDFVQLNVINPEPGFFYQWSNSQTGPSISAEFTQTTVLTVSATNPANGCMSMAQVTVEVLPTINTDFGEIGVLTCLQPCIEFMGATYCQPGNYNLSNGNCTTITFSIGADPGIPTIVLPVVMICEGECYSFFGQPICNSSTVSLIDNCTLFEQEVVVQPNVIEQLGVVGAVRCSQPCVEFNGVTYCQPGTYSVSDPALCLISNFEIEFLRDTIQAGEVGVITCSQPCIDFAGMSYCAPGDYVATDSCSSTFFSIGIDLSEPECSIPQLTCQPSNTQYTVAFSITGLPPFKVNGQTIAGANFLSNPIPNGTPYNFVVEQNNGCQTLVSGSFDCASMCGTDAGLLSGETLHGCIGQTTIQANALTQPVLAPGDVLEYRLETVSGALLDRNATGLFAFLPALMQTEQVYQVRRWAGPPDGNGHPDLTLACTDSSSAQPVIFHALPDVDIATSTLQPCLNDVVSLSASGALAYLWESGMNTAIVDTALSTLTPYQFTVTGTDNFGCSQTASITLQALPTPIFDALEIRQPACDEASMGGIRVLAAHGNGTPLMYALNDGAFAGQSTFDNLLPGSYTLQVMDAAGCVYDSVVWIEKPVPGVLDIGPDQTVALGETVSLQANVSQPVISLQWSSDAGLSQSGGTQWQFQPLQSMLVRCETIDSNGCIATDEAQVLVNIEAGIYRPNIIQPGATQQDNQFFTLFAANGWIQDIDLLQVFDRWGELVWEGKNFAPNEPVTGWDGMAKGVKASPGVYVYAAVVTLANGDKRHLKGDVTLVR